jgi:hypothetical protein
MFVNHLIYGQRRDFGIYVVMMIVLFAVNQQDGRLLLNAWGLLTLPGDRLAAMPSPRSESPHWTNEIQELLPSFCVSSRPVTPNFLSASPKIPRPNAAHRHHQPDFFSLSTGNSLLYSHAILPLALRSSKSYLIRRSAPSFLVPLTPPLTLQTPNESRKVPPNPIL